MEERWGRAVRLATASPEGKASAVQFIRFGFTREAIAAFKTPGAHVVIGFDHQNYPHMAALPEDFD